MLRSKTMATAAAAALVVLVSAATGASFAARPTGCHIKLEPAAPRLVQYGETALVFGQIKCVPGSLAASQSVSLLERVAGSVPSTTPAATATTDTGGRFQLTTPPLEKNTRLYVVAGGVRSARRLVKVSPKVTISGPPDGSVLYTGRGPFLGAHHFGVLRNRVTFSGTVSPTLAGDAVVLQRESALTGEAWHRIGIGFVSSTGTYSIQHTFAVPGAADIRILVRHTKVSAPGVSESLSYVILQAQNPNLTIESTKDPIKFGEPVTVTGIDKAGPGVQLTLFARSGPSRQYTAVATTTTTAGGAYSFPTQTPPANTRYKVVAAGSGAPVTRNSAALFEGVKFLLTATPSTESAPQGQTVTFAGTVSPAVAGHPIYLQKQNPSGIAFHVIEVGTVGPTGAYSLPYVPFVTGAHVYRVRIPGDPAHEGSAGQLITVTTTLNTGAIQPEPARNGTPPKQGD
jgi:hypothetical protein